MVMEIGSSDIVLEDWQLLAGIKMHMDDGINLTMKMYKAFWSIKKQYDRNGTISDGQHDYLRGMLASQFNARDDKEENVTAHFERYVQEHLAVVNMDEVFS